MPEEKKTTRKTAPKKETTEKKPRAPRKPTKKTEPTAAEQEIFEASADENTSEVAPLLPIKTYKVATVLPQEGLKIRKGPGVGFDKYAGVKISTGTEVAILEEKDGFVRIGYEQWVMKNYLGGI